MLRSRHPRVLEEQRFRAASWGELQRSFEGAAGRSLSSVFDQWLNRPGGPAVTIASAVAKTEAGKVRLTLIVEQSSPAYVMRVPVEIVYVAAPKTRWMEVGRQREGVTVNVDALPTGVRLDPDLRVWRVLERGGSCRRSSASG